MKWDNKGFAKSLQVHASAALPVRGKNYENHHFLFDVERDRIERDGRRGREGEKEQNNIRLPSGTPAHYPARVPHMRHVARVFETRVSFVHEMVLS